MRLHLRLQQVELRLGMLFQQFSFPADLLSEEIQRKIGKAMAEYVHQRMRETRVVRKFLNRVL